MAHINFLNNTQVLVTQKFHDDYLLAKKKLKDAESKFNPYEVFTEDSSILEITEESTEKQRAQFAYQETKNKHSRYLNLLRTYSKQPEMQAARVKYGSDINNEGKITKAKKRRDNAALAIFTAGLVFSVASVAVVIVTGGAAAPIFLGLAAFTLPAALFDIRLVLKEKKQDRDTEKRIIEEKNKNENDAVEDEINQLGKVTKKTQENGVNKTLNNGINPKIITKSEEEKLNIDKLLQLSNERENKEIESNEGLTDESVKLEKTKLGDKIEQASQDNASKEPTLNFYNETDGLDSALKGNSNNNSEKKSYKLLDPIDLTKPFISDDDTMDILFNDPNEQPNYDRNLNSRKNKKSTRPHTPQSDTSQETKTNDDEKLKYISDAALPNSALTKITAENYEGNFTLDEDALNRIKKQLELKKTTRPHTPQSDTSQETKTNDDSKLNNDTKNTQQHKEKSLDPFQKFKARQEEQQKRRIEQQKKASTNDNQRTSTDNNSQTPKSSKNNKPTIPKNPEERKAFFKKLYTEAAQGPPNLKLSKPSVKSPSDSSSSTKTTEDNSVTDQGFTEKEFFSSRGNSLIPYKNSIHKQYLDNKAQQNHGESDSEQKDQRQPNQAQTDYDQKDSAQTNQDQPKQNQIVQHQENWFSKLNIFGNPKRNARNNNTASAASTNTRDKKPDNGGSKKRTRRIHRRN